MSDPIKHECGIAMVRLLKPLSFYQKKYGTPMYPLNKLYLLMEKQHNRGQDGAGIACIKFDVKPGKRYIAIERSNDSEPIRDVFKKAHKDINRSYKKKAKKMRSCDWVKENIKFCGELFLGHLRYGTYGKNNIDACHPFLRENNWISRNLVLAGNFNLTNVPELFQILIEIGQHPLDMSDTVTILEKIGHFLDNENERLYLDYRKRTDISKREIAKLVARDLNVMNVLRDSCKKWDGGYVITGLLGHGDAFILRDPSGIRPAYFYQDDEVFVAASERPVIQTAFNVSVDSVREVEPGHALIIKKNGLVTQEPFTDPKPRKACSFERIYFSRGTDAEIYQERKNLGQFIVRKVLKAVDDDIENTVFSFIPNTAETCFYGMLEGLRDYCDEIKKEIIMKTRDSLTTEELDKIMRFRPRVDKIAVKDAKLRTFITEDSERGDLVAHVYDITYGAVKRGTDNLVVIDDSIVRGTTLRESILKILDRLGPKKIVLVSSAPQIRYPDCYGIDMAKLGDFVAFQAAVELLRDTKRSQLLDEVYKRCKAELDAPGDAVCNHVKEIYAPFTADQISDKVSELLTPEGIGAEVKIMYQTIENLHKACPNHLGDWYFTGDYPTPGGNRVVNQAFVNYIDGNDARAY